MLRFFRKADASPLASPLTKSATEATALLVPPTAAPRAPADDAYRSDVDGLRAWVISAEPRSDYEPQDRETKMLTKVRGRVWIAQHDHAWVKADIVTFENFSWGIRFKLHKGAEIRFTQQWINNHVWMPQDWYVRMRGKAALIVGINGEFSGSYDNFRKFTTESTPAYADDGS